MATKKVTSATKKTETAKVESAKAETVKAASVKAEPEKTVEVKAEPAKEPAAKAEPAKTPVTEAAEEKKAPEKKAPAKKTTTTKAAAKKPAAKKTTAKKTTAKKEMKVNAFIQYYGKQVEEQDIVARVKKAWTASGNKIGDIKTMDLYIKPEEASVYYVINETEKGAVAF